MHTFPSRMFRWAAIYGVFVLTPLYFTPLPREGAEVLLGFVGLALVFQAVFWTIGGDPAKYRALMPNAVKAASLGNERLIGQLVLLR